MVMCNELSNKRHIEKMCATNPGFLEGEIAQLEKFKLYLKKCYKVTKKSSTDQYESHNVTVIFDTSASLNVIR